MRVTSTKKYYTGIILFAAHIIFLCHPGLATEKPEEDAGPVIAGVVINSCIGSITISVTSGTAPYTYAWEDSGGNPIGTNSFIVTGLGPDNYTVTVTDANGDDVTATYTVTNPPDLVGTVVVNNVTCRGDSDAQVIVTMTNGNPDYDWELFDSGNNSVQTGTAPFPTNIITIGGLGVDSYTLEVEDDDGCTGTINFNIVEPAQFLGATLVDQNNATCSNSTDGSLEVVGTGGWGGYTYAWYNAASAFLGTGTTISGLSPGDYTVVITDANGCQVSPTYTITGPAAITNSAVLTHATCNGDSDGAIDITPGGGNGTFSYLWSNGAITQDLSGIGAGSYSVTITDIQGCTYNENFTITEPAVLAINEAISNVNCNGGSDGTITSNVSGGTTAYTYAWSTGATSADLAGLSAGSYTLTVTDVNNCQTIETFTVTEPAQPLAVTGFSETLPTCFGGADGTLQVNVTGGTTAYIYLWSTGATTATITGLSSGSYAVNVTDANGCVTVGNYTLNDPVAISVSASVTIPSCNGGADGSITASASNGLAPYVYNWNTGDVGATVTGLSTGTYNVTVTDANGCSVVENVLVGEPDPILSNAAVNDISCNGLTDGNISLAVTGGTGPYTYNWNTGSSSSGISGLSSGTYTVTITDANACTEVDNFTIIEPAPIGTSLTQIDVLCRGNSTGSINLTPSGGTAPYTYLWSTGATSQDLSTLAAGTYTVTVTDASLCTTTASTTITQPATSLSVSGIETHATCNGSSNGAIDLTVSGGVGPYTVLWNTGATTEDITALAAGSYSVQVTDANGCVSNTAFTITEPSPFLVNPTVDDITCNGDNDGAITLAVSGGTAPYTYSWADGPTTQNRSGLAPGNYTLTATDANGCQNVQMLTISEPAVLTTSTIQQNVNCFGESTGVINLTVNGGTAPYAYAWSSGSTSEDLTAIAAGTYTVTVTDANGCTSGETVTITEPAAALTYTSSVSQISCNGAADGSIDLTVSGGTGPYTYNWSNGSTSEDLSGLSAAVYNVVITDAQGCTANETFTITDPPVLSLSGTESDVSCFGAADGAIDLVVTGGEAPYTYIWAHGPVTEDVSGLGPGSYSVQVLDNRGCSALTSFTIAEPGVLALSSLKTDVSCFGGNDATIDLTVTGGTGPYTYNWSNGSNSQDLSTLVSGTYTVTVTDLNGCSDTETVTIDQPAAALSKTETLTNVTCNGLANGTIDLTVSGGTAPYTYSWNDGFITEDRNALGPGTYIVTITDANGCQLVDSYTIIQPDVLTLSEAVNQVSCFGADDGDINLTVTGGTAPYTYAWADGPTTEDRTGLSPGSYTIVVTDANGCQENTSVTITEPAVLAVNESTTDVDCFGNATGAIDVTVSGGTAPFAYSWSGGETTEDLSNLVAGTYTLTVTDLNACSVIETFTVSEPAAALSLTEVVTDVTCNGLGNGTIDITVAGGTAPYSYSWSDGGILEDKSALTPGNYNVTVTDANGCQIMGAYSITEPTVLSSSLSADHISCFAADDGEIDISVSGGTAPYTYLWADGATTEDRSNLSPGPYSVVITDANGCQTNEAITITEPTALGITELITDVDCFGNATGAIDITVSGGTTPYLYAWSDGSGTEDLGSLTAGTYTVTVTDANGCQLIQPVTVSEPAQPLAINEVVNDITCFGANDGNIQLNMTGGTAPYTFSWAHGATTENISGLLVGNYQVLVTDANGCTTSGFFTIDSPAALQLSSSVQNLSCNSAGDGEIDLTLTGGTAPYSFNWSNGATSEDLTGIAAGNYSVTVTDANGCSLVRNFTVTEPLTLIASGLVTDVVCFGQGDGSIEVSVSGGVTLYAYLWSNGAVTEDLFNVDGGNYSLTVTDANGCQTVQNFVVDEPVSALSISGLTSEVSCFGVNDGSITTTISGGTAPYVYSWNQGAITKDISGLGPGAYQLTVTDANGCSLTESFTVTGPDALQAATSVTNLSCNGAGDGEIDLSITGGTVPYSYSWSNGATSQDISGLSAGTYQVLITDANGCSLTEVVTVQEPAVLNLTSSGSDVSCFSGTDGSINLTVAGGTFPYAYSWSNGETSEDLSALSAGSYTVTVTDNNGCSAVQTVVISEPTQLTLAGTATDITCNGLDNGTIITSVAGGTTPYAYVWSDGSTDQNRISLAPGSYTVTVTDANNCQVSETYAIDQPDALALNYSSDDISCFGAADGEIDMTITGGTAPYTYLWSDGVITEDRDNLGPGSYTLTVMDANSCQVSQAVVIDEPAVLNLSYTQTNVNCFGDATGGIDLTITGGTAPYAYNWSGGETVEDLTNLAAGTYSVTVTDANGCSTAEVVTITEPAAALAFSAEMTTQVTCNGYNDGAIDLTITGGTAPYSFNWTDGSTSEDRSSLTAGNYEVTVTDANGCQISNAYSITEPTILTTSFTFLNVSCFGVGDGSIDLTVSGGTSPYVFAWSDGVTTEDRTGLTPGTYTVLVTDANGCQSSESVTITQPDALALGQNVVDVSCFGDDSGSIDITITGGTSPYTYNWSNGATTEDVNTLLAGSYAVTVTDVRGCSISQTITVSEPAAALSASADLSHETCATFADGGIDLTVTGGTAPYSYSWNTGNTTEDISGLLPGTYQVTVSDNNGCEIIQNYTITGPQPLSLVGTVTQITCRNAADGEIDLTVTGGTAPYTYAWSSGETTEDLTGLDIGSVSVLVTDANGCTVSESFTITQPLELVANSLVEDVTCFGADDGSIDLSITGGTAPYTYSWSNGATTQDISDLSGGAYTVGVLDANGCQVTAVITVEAPSAPLAATTSITGVSCNGQPTGRIDLTVTGGTAPYSYAWSNGSSQQNLINAFAGTYEVIVTDIKGCVFTESYTIEEPDPLSAIFNVTPTSCFGDSDGTILVAPAGGTGPYSYVWSNGSTSKDQVNLAGGTYNVTITDANNCSVVLSAFVGDSRDLSVDVAKVDILCKGEPSGAISLNVTGGSGAYTYLWNNGETSRDLSGVAAGVYQVVISDAGGCATTASVVISEPAAELSINVDRSPDMTCFGETSGFARVVPQGGVAPYSYLWSNGARTAEITDIPAGEYTITVSDANGCTISESFRINQPEAPISIVANGNLDLACMGNSDGNIQLAVTGGTGPYTYLWSTGSDDNAITDLVAGDYTVRVVDALGCVKEQTFTVRQPDELRIANAFVNESQCFDDRNGSIELEITGGTQPYHYQWSNEATTKNIIGISSGEYNVVVTDARGCSVQASYTLADPGLFRLSPEVSEISCVGANDASISLNIEGGVGDLAIRWNTGHVGETLTELSPGIYNVTVSDENGCSLQQTFNIIEPLPVTLDAFVQDAIKCGDPKSGQINLIVSGGRAPYAYRWSNGATSQSLTDLFPGTYAVTVTDSYGCTASGTYGIQQPDPLKIGLRTEILVNCDTRLVSNRVVADVSGGFGGYRYEWSRGESNGAEIIVSEPGRLTLFITDDRGCELEKSIDIRIPELGEADFDFTSESIVRDGAPAANDPVSFFDESFGDIIDWAWNFGDGFDSREVDPIHTYSAPGTYTVTLTVTDGSGCTSLKTDIIEITEGYRIMVPDAFTPNGDGNNDFFRPRLLGLEKVQLLIFNTWGEVIFNTEDVNTPGWDGTIRGKPAENGNYVYKLVGLSFNGLKVERDGVFALIN